MSIRLALGLTGDVGAGKSRVLAWLVGRGASGLDADGLVHQLLRQDAAVIRAVRARFGEGVLGQDGINRDRLAAIVFEDPEALADLERIVHPAVIDRVRQWLSEQAAPVAVIEAAKLIESGFHRELDRVWLVTCPAHIRRQRLLERGWLSAEVARRMAASPPLAPRLAAADLVIDNGGPWTDTERQLEAAWQTLQPGASESGSHLGALEG